MSAIYRIKKGTDPGGSVPFTDSPLKTLFAVQPYRVTLVGFACAIISALCYRCSSTGIQRGNKQWLLFRVYRIVSGGHFHFHIYFLRSFCDVVVGRRSILSVKSNLHGVLGAQVIYPCLRQRDLIRQAVASGRSRVIIISATAGQCKG